MVVGRRERKIRAPGGGSASELDVAGEPMHRRISDRISLGSHGLDTKFTLPGKSYKAIALRPLTRIPS